MSARFRLLAILAVWLFPAALALDLSGCNDGSTGCCRICPECACGDSCISCATRCTLPKGCACSSSTQLEPAALRMSIPPDAGSRD